VVLVIILLGITLILVLLILKMAQEKEARWKMLGFTLEDVRSWYTKPLIHHKKPREAKEPCDKCGGKMVEKLGKYGIFYACSNYPKCKNTIKIEIDE